MTITVDALLPLAPVAISLVVIAFTVLRLRRPMRLRVLPILIGAVGPAVAAGLYLFITKPPFNPFTAAVLVVATLVLGARLGRRPKTWTTEAGPAIRRPILPLALWAIVYLIALALPVLLATPEGRAGGALLMLGSAGICVGAALGLLVRRVRWARGDRDVATG